MSNPLHLPLTAGATADGLVTLDHVSLQEFCPALSKQSQGHYSASRSAFTLSLTDQTLGYIYLYSHLSSLAH